MISIFALIAMIVTIGKIEMIGTIVVMHSKNSLRGIIRNFIHLFYENYTFKVKPDIMVLGLKFYFHG